MPEGCKDNEHVWWEVSADKWPHPFRLKVDDDGLCRCYCGKITLTQFSSPPPMCEACNHPQPHHLNGWCYGPVEYDMDDCGCRRFVPKPPQVPGPRKITL